LYTTGCIVYAPKGVLWSYGNIEFTYNYFYMFFPDGVFKCISKN